MRTNLIISLLLLVLTIAAGLWEEQGTQKLSDRYVSAAMEIRIMLDKEDWSRASETARTYSEQWQRAVHWLQVLINHEDIDDVTLALVRLQAAIEASDLSSGYEACAELEENARHIHHRDAFTLGSVL